MQKNGVISLLPHTSRRKIFNYRLVCGEFRQVCDKIGSCRAISDSARSQNVLSGLVGQCASFPTWRRSNRRSSNGHPKERTSFLLLGNSMNVFLTTQLLTTATEETTAWQEIATEALRIRLLYLPCSFQSSGYPTLDPCCSCAALGTPLYPS